MLVYRDGRREVRTAELLDELIRSVRGVAADSAIQSELLLTALLRAGALECALSDGAASSPPFCSSAVGASQLTDAIADALVGSVGASPAIDVRSNTTLKNLAHKLESLSLPQHCSLSVPEGFAYYALDPLAYADAAAKIETGDRPVFVIGLRTIGATLSSIVAAAGRRRGAHVERTTVRPTGHPWDRRTEFTPEQQRRILDAVSRRAMFLVVDEGPGLSGSSLVSVADALAELGIAQSDVVVICAHAPNLGNLRSRRAAECWPRLRVVTAGRTLQPPTDSLTDWSGGLWRPHLYRDVSRWPATWPQAERLKFVSIDGERVYKFEGLGPYGERTLERSRAAAEAGWSAAVEPAGNGFAAYARIEGDPMRDGDLDPDVLDTLARYCDFRQREMRTEHASVEPLREMMRVNVREEFGIEHEPETPEIARPVIADARMMPHEWLRDRSGRAWKSDVASHGDDHFYPGATDIAWDLAGAIVEWRMDDAVAEAFVRRYRAISGDDARRRLPFFLNAYAAFRVGFCRMAAESCAEERERLTREAEYYAALLSPVRQAGAKAQSAFRSCSPA